MEVRMLFMYSFASFFPEIHLHTPMMTCLGFVFISWASSFFIFSRRGSFVGESGVLEIL